MTIVRHGHVFENITVSGHANAIFGDVHISSPDFIEHMTTVEKRRALLNALFYEDMNLRVARIETAKPQTCDWVWTTPFTVWLEEPDPSDLFWISGKAGSGKSTLMKYLAASEKTRNRLPAPLAVGKEWSISHFFFDFRAASQTANNEQGLLRTLMYQITSELPLERDVLAKYDLTLEHILASQHVELMIDILSQLLASEKLNVLFFVDGLDEYEHDMREMIQLLQTIRVRTGLRLCVASRPEPIIQALIGSAPQVKVQNHNTSGIESYVRTTVDAVATNIQVHSNVSNEAFVTYILENAEGVFLWVHFAVNTLLEHLILGCTEDEIRGELELLPNQLDKMYNRIFDQIPTVCRSEAAMTLYLVQSASHVVTLGLLHRVWLFIHSSIGTGPSNFETLSIEMFQLRLRGFLGGLLDFGVPQVSDEEHGKDEDDGATMTTVRVRLLHETLRAYMRDRCLIKQWINVKVEQEYPDYIWLRLYSETLAQADNTLSAVRWNIIDELTHIYKVERIKTRRPWRATRARLNEHMQSQVMRLRSEGAPLQATSLLMLRYAIVNIDTVAREAAVYTGPLHDMYSKSLRTPLILLYDTLQSRIRQVGLPFKSYTQDWPYDLSFAAARAWSAYYNAHWSRLKALTPAQTNYLLLCAGLGSAIFLSVQQDDNHVQEDAIPILVLLLQSCSIDNAHVAFFMHPRFSKHLSKLLPPLRKGYVQTQPRLPPWHVNVDGQRWPSMYPRQAGYHQDLVQLWLSEILPEQAFEQWTMFLVNVGFDLNAWRDSTGRNIMLRLLDQAGCPLPESLFSYQVSVMKNALTLEKSGVVFPWWIPEGASCRDKLEKLLMDVTKRLSEIRFKAKVVLTENRQYKAALEDLLQRFEKHKQAPTPESFVAEFSHQVQALGYLPTSDESRDIPGLETTSEFSALNTPEIHLDTTEEARSETIGNDAAKHLRPGSPPLERRRSRIWGTFRTLRPKSVG